MYDVLNEVYKVSEELYNRLKPLLRTEKVKTLREPIYFSCSCCGLEYKTSLDMIKAGKNKHFYCKECNPHAKPTIEKLRKIFEERGAELITTEYKNSKQPLEFKCSNCGKVHHITYDKLFKRNPQLRCPDCLGKASWPTLQEINEAIGGEVEYRVDTVVSFDPKIYYMCKVCKRESVALWSKIRNRNFSFVCPNCDSSKPPLIEDIRKEFENKGAELLTDQYRGRRGVLRFKCSFCKKEHYITWERYRNGQNPDLLCPDCYGKKATAFLTSRFNNKRSYIIFNFYEAVFEFFNIRRKDRDLYSAHHISRYTESNEDRLSFSFLNGYPLIRDQHSGNSRFYHNMPQGRDVNQWPEEAKLFYHTYENFRFLDFNSTLIADILEPITGDRNHLVERKKDFWQKGIQYVPIFKYEMHSREQRDIIYSMIRLRLYKTFKDIYEYTGSKLKVYYARKLIIKEFEHEKAKIFFGRTHAQGNVPAPIYIGLFTEEGDLIEAMSWGTPRGRGKVTYEYELLRLSTELNTIVLGGTARLFKYFIDNYSPESIVSFCDRRFCSENIEETVYYRLGFKYDGFSSPNYRYYDPETKKSYSRQVFQKHKLKDKLKIFDESKSETDNMLANGYIKQYDCGNFKFVWFPPKDE